MPDHDVLLCDDSTRYVMRVHDRDDSGDLQRKLLARRPASLTMAELVSLVWDGGTTLARASALATARRIVREYGERAISHEADPVRLADALSIPLEKACQLVACFELGRRCYGTRSGHPVCVRTAQQAFSYVSAMAESSKEQLRGLYLNSRYEVVHDEVISVGSLTANIVHPREVFQPALLHSAAAVIVAHNHPSGTVEPTADDLDVTAQLRAAGALLGIELLDHLIVTKEHYYSIIEEGHDV